MTIPKSFINDLVARIDILDVIGCRVKLRKMGGNLVGLCPFHNEKTPSFTVNQPKQFFHCFGCGAHGSVISFIMQFEHLSFVETIENLANLAGLTVPIDSNSNNNNQTQYTECYNANAAAAAFFEKQLIQSKKCIDYLKSRGLTGTICKKFMVGYAPNTWKIPEINPNLLITTGLLSCKDDITYPRFRGRAMFPIRNPKGMIIGFGGRTLGNDLAKYINSPETILFHKGEELYGLYEAKTANNHKLDTIIVVEGYLDVISLAQFDVTNAVATLGTAISTKQVQLLLRNTSNLVFCFDGDKAGRSAAWRALENSLPIMRDGIQINFLFLPEGYDPDDIIRKETKAGFMKLVENAVPLADFFINQLSLGININNIDGRAKFAKTGLDWLKKMPYSIFRQMVLERIASIAKIATTELETLETHSNFQDNKNIPITTPTLTTLNDAISMLLHCPELFLCIKDLDDIKNIDLPGIELLYKLLFTLKKQQNLSMAAILESWRGREEFEIFSKLACKKPIISTENLKNEFIGIIQLLKETERESMIKQMLIKAASKELTIEERKELQNLISMSKNKKWAENI